MKILTVVGARPQFIKAAPLSRALRFRHTEILVHTGQHYDYEMSQVFFEGLDIPRPDHEMEVGSASHAEQTARMLAGLEKIMLDVRPEIVVVFGDTNSTLAGAMAAAKLNIPIAHVEAGLRSFNRAMPEEINRILTDRVSTLLFCPTMAAMNNLRAEGITFGLHCVGDVMFDVAKEAALKLDHGGLTPAILARFGVTAKQFLFCTIHRASNTDDPARLGAIFDALIEQGEPVVLPLHPRTRARLDQAGLAPRLAAAKHLLLTEPLGYLDCIALQRAARVVLTDSGGIQKEACFFKVPCITLRDETEWVETVQCGWNVLTGAHTQRILTELRLAALRERHFCIETEFADGKAAERIAGKINRNELTPPHI
ncbi:MAG: UDP-N-acetyl glucosamine 2-epimerase [Phycisphaerae bacterium]|nr:MAG: UDP-N-acetylglucosamine 2-epimerase (non-hydrolyzing) [Planctomycetia bacterium]RIK69860.1 MAG: UDP-N-acetylglucosamine 2-epimerase (non-hydrolyzing) [Planctomycetota bacterium]GJQ25305.1 MAG: UDP-N-acetyl glucosamine 2-epimerase [Phycisphaerae bacterium]